MQTDIELGESCFVHRKSQIQLLTTPVITVSCKESACYHIKDFATYAAFRVPNPPWLPRARRFRLLLLFHFAHDVGLHQALTEEVDSILAALIDGAEAGPRQLWPQLGYEASQLQSHKFQYNGGGSTLQLDFEINSQEDYDDQVWCPSETASCRLTSLQLRFFLEGVDRPEKSPAWVLSDPEYDEVQLQEPKLNEDILSVLVDAGLRSSICSNPISLSPALRRLSDQRGSRLSELAPATFVPNYIQRLQEQAELIPGISRLLTKYLNSIPPQGLSTPTNPPHMGHFNSHESCNVSTNKMQKQLWDVLRRGQQSDHFARRLRPLKRTRLPRLPDIMLDIPRTMQQPRDFLTEDLARIDRESDISTVLVHQGADEDCLFDFCLNLNDQAVHHSKDMTKEIFGYKVGHLGVGMHDVDLESEGQSMGGFYDCLIEEGTCPDPHQDECRKHSRSLSRRSDVSMLLNSERPITNGPEFEQSLSIGGLSWLTENIIRMHPLKQQMPGTKTVEHQGSTRTRNDMLHDGSDHDGWSDTSNPTDPPLEDGPYHSTTNNAEHIWPIFEPSSEHDSEPDYFDLDCDFGITSRSEIGVPPMSIHQNREDLNGSLEDLIGSDHLLWHMWQRRASVAPRGEEDIKDLKTLFATDPDMKLFGSGWDLSPSDISSGSNEDPMLQDFPYSSSAQNKDMTPMSPTSERRSYFAPTRPSSSSGYVGRSSTDPGRRSSLIKRFTWGGRRRSVQAQSAETSEPDQRTIEVKRRKTLVDYEQMDKEASNDDDSGDMLF